MSTLWYYKDLNCVFNHPNHQSIHSNNTDGNNSVFTISPAQRMGSKSPMRQEVKTFGQGGVSRNWHSDWMRRYLISLFSLMIILRFVMRWLPHRPVTVLRDRWISACQLVDKRRRTLAFTMKNTKDYVHNCWRDNTWKCGSFQNHDQNDTKPIPFTTKMWQAQQPSVPLSFR